MLPGSSLYERRQLPSRLRCLSNQLNEIWQYLCFIDSDADEFVRINDAFIQSPQETANRNEVGIAIVSSEEKISVPKDVRLNVLAIRQPIEAGLIESN
jgi:hypothetical protein